MHKNSFAAMALPTSLLILYGSETGTAQDTAESLWRDSKYRNLEARVLAMDDFHIKCLPDEKYVIFVVATSGQGDLPTNMRINWRKLLSRNLPDDLLKNVSFLNAIKTKTIVYFLANRKKVSKAISYQIHKPKVRVFVSQAVTIAVFGLGDSSYSKYNFAGKKLYRRLIQLGANPLLNLGLGDDQHDLGLDGGFGPWREELWEKLYESRFFENMILDFPADKLLPPRYKLDWLDEESQDFSKNSNFSASENSYLPVRVLENERVTATDHFQDTRLISFCTNTYEKLPNNPLKYEPGDVLMVYPYNLTETVDLAIEALGYSEELLRKPLRLRSNDMNLPLPPKWIIHETTTLRTCLEKFFDLQMIPRRSLFELLSKISTNKMEKERLAELASPQGLDDYLDYCQRPRRSVAEMLRDFPNTAKNIPPDRLFDIFSTIRARAFSIASSPKAHSGKIQLLVAKVEYKAKRMAAKRLGLCSNFIARLIPGDEVFVRIRAGTFRRNLNDPLLLIGPGTGIAPFRSMISDSNCLSSNLPYTLFFGCRSSQKDYYFKQEWPNFKNLSLYVAFSRDNPTKKVYVQHKMKENASEIWNFLQQSNARIFLAGSANQMPKDVLDCLTEIFKENGVENADVFVQNLEKTGKLQFETWS